MAIERTFSIIKPDAVAAGKAGHILTHFVDGGLRPVALRMLHMSYWGFDSEPHVGTMVVNAGVTQDVLAVFSKLYSERFPIRQMVPEDVFQGSDTASMAADNTSGFNCRYAVAPGPKRWSVTFCSGSAASLACTVAIVPNARSRALNPDSQ